MQFFEFSIDARAELLEKTRAKWDRATFCYSEHQKHSRKCMQNALSRAARPKKLWKLEQNRDPTLNRHQKVKIPRAYACKTPTQDLLEVKICEIPKKNDQKLKTDQGAKKVLKRETCAENAQNAIHVAETLPRRSECDTRRQNEV